MRNPFQYGKIAEDENFIDRDADRAFLKQSLQSGINVILISPRRWGKSSLVKRAMGELCSECKEVRVCYIDAFPITSSAEFYKVFAKAVLRASASRWQNIVDASGKFLRSIAPRLSFGADPMNEFSLSFELSDREEDTNEILNLPERIAKDKHLQIVICIDEFQSLAKLKDYSKLESRMRSVWQHQQKTSYCLYGSHRHMMSDIFDSPEKPFFRFGQVYHLQKIAAEDWIRYIVERFSSTGKQISEELAGRIVETVDRHSWYVQQLASAVWNFTSEQADEETFRKGLIWCVDVNSESYRNVCNTLTELQLNLLKAVAKGEKQLSSADALKNYHLGTSASVIKNKKLLLKMDLLTQMPAGLDFLDPLFRIWFIENWTAE